MILIGNAKDIEEAKKIGLDYIDLEGGAKFKKDKRAVKKWCKPYKLLLASSSLINKVPRVFGSRLNKVRKFPYLYDNEKMTLEEKVEEMKA